MTYYDIDVLYKIFDDFFQPPTLEADQTGLFVLQHIRRINDRITSGHNARVPMFIVVEKGELSRVCSICNPNIIQFSSALIHNRITEQVVNLDTCNLNQWFPSEL